MLRDFGIFQLENCFLRQTSLLLVAFLFLLGRCDTSKPKKVSNDQSMFQLVSASESGVRFVNTLTESLKLNYLLNEAMYLGAGVAVGDLNNDGLPDLYFAGNQVPNKLYKNKGNFQFEDVTDKSGTAESEGWSTGVSLADVNADGLLDIYVCRWLYEKQPELRRNLLYINKGNFSFEESAVQYGLADEGFSSQAYFFDMDRDGDLDVYVVNQPPNDKYFRENLRNKIDYAYTDRLYMNDGNGKFSDITASSGIANYAYGLSAAIGDFNQNGWPDIYVANDYSEPDYLYLNLGNGKFRNVIDLAIDHISNFSMGSDLADVNNDGFPDLFVADMVAEDNYRLKANMSGMAPERFYELAANGYHRQYMFNMLQLNNGNGSFSEISQLAGIFNTDWSWATLFADFDLDGFRDLYITNGIKRDVRNNDNNKKVKAYRAEKEAESPEGEPARLSPLDALNLYPSRKLSNYMFRNKGGDPTEAFSFENISESWGMDQPSFSQGAVYADLDKDGDLDLVVNNMDEPAFLYQNMASDQKRGNYLKLNFKGSPTNQFGVGAKVKLESGSMIFYAEHQPARGYMSTVQHGLHFGLGELSQVDRLTVTWPDGKVQQLSDLKSNKSYTLSYKDASAENSQPQKAPGSFVDISRNAAVDFQHTENEYDDFLAESLLPHRMSTLGPFLSNADVNKDGLDDFYVGGAAGQSGHLYFQQTDGTFSLGQAFEAEKSSEDMDAAFFDAEGDGDMDLYVVSGGNEFPSGNARYRDRLYINDGTGKFIASNQPLPLASGSCVKAGDFDGDGDADLFVGGRQSPGKYPFPGISFLLENQNGKFVNVTEEKSPDLSEAGMVTDASWTDYNEDGKIDLIIVGEWMPISLYLNENGNFVNKTSESGLDNTSGWWNTIETADLDQDGDPDFVVGNLGWNIKYKASETEPFGVHCHDFDANGSLDIVLSYYNQGKNFPLRGRECSSSQMPFIKDSFPDYHHFASATLSDVYAGVGLEDALHYDAVEFSSCWLKNLGSGNFELIPLPSMAQFSTVNGIVIEDFDGDGKQEILLAGNHFEREVETVRSDASIGLLLKLSEAGEWKATAPSKSGIKIKGDVKDLCLLKNTAYGKPLILASKNNDRLQFLLPNTNEQ